MHVNFNKYGLFFFLPTLFLILNAKRLTLGITNFEWTFFELANYFNNNNNIFDISLFKSIQANSTFYSLILCGLKKITAIFYIEKNNLLIVYRGATILFLFYLLYKIHISQILNKNEKYILTFLILFIPSYSIYYYKIYPDALSFIFSYLSILQLLENKKKITLPVIFYSISILLKPVAIILYPLFILIMHKKKFNLLLFLLLTILPYIIYMILFEKIIFSGPMSSIYYNFGLTNVFVNFFRYISYSFTILGPTLIYVVYLILKNKKKINLIPKIIIFSLLSLLISLFLKSYSDQGEMNFGPFDSILTEKFIFFTNFCIIFLIFFFFYEVFFFSSKRNKILSILFFLLVLILSILIFRPTQRYLIYILPIIFYLISNILIKNISIKKLIVLLAVNFVYYSTINEFQYYVQKKKEILQNEIILYLNINNILNKSNPDTILHSNGLYFLNYIKNKKDFTYSKLEYTIKEGCLAEQGTIKRFNTKILHKDYCIYITKNY
jgi:hypothetical protein